MQGNELYKTSPCGYEAITVSKMSVSVRGGEDGGGGGMWWNTNIRVMYSIFVCLCFVHCFILHRCIHNKHNIHIIFRSCYSD